jgi:hypothetical protein
MPRFPRCSPLLRDGQPCTRTVAEGRSSASTTLSSRRRMAPMSLSEGCRGATKPTEGHRRNERPGGSARFALRRRKLPSVEQNAPAPRGRSSRSSARSEPTNA